MTIQVIYVNLEVAHLPLPGHVCDLERGARPFWLRFPTPVRLPQPCAVNRQQRHWVQGYPDEVGDYSG